MYTKRLKDRVSSASPLCIGYLNKHVLKINKLSSKDNSTKGNIQFSNNLNDIVFGVIFSINDSSQIVQLDSFEGLNYGYNKKVLSIETVDKGQLNCFAYVADESSISNNVLPFDWYLNFIILGSKEHKLPTFYINFLSKLEKTVDTDINRILEAKRIIEL